MASGVTACLLMAEIHSSTAARGQVWIRACQITPQGLKMRLKCRQKPDIAKLIKISRGESREPDPFLFFAGDLEFFHYLHRSWRFLPPDRRNMYILALFFNIIQQACPRTLYIIQRPCRSLLPGPNTLSGNPRFGSEKVSFRTVKMESILILGILSYL